MDEKHWLAMTQNAQYMVFTLKSLGHPRTKIGQRKLRLFAVGCCRAAWHLLGEPCLRSAVEVAERFADDRANKGELADAARRVDEEWFAGRLPTADTLAEWSAASFVRESCSPSAHVAAFSMTAISPCPLSNEHGGEAVLCDLLRCVFGNPFQKPVFNKKWRTETVKTLATGIYEERAFDRLPILADALEEAGCDDPAMLSHLRGPGPHCRGCWVVDLARGKSPTLLSDAPG
ncbi:MAG: hypothetical protein MUF18_05150 [Fimbriiglobus sp.]|nr:hypothetical protein [Fimbriiglobus sp.]